MNLRKRALSRNLYIVCKIRRQICVHTCPQLLRVEFERKCLNSPRKVGKLIPYFPLFTDAAFCNWIIRLGVPPFSPIQNQSKNEIVEIGPFSIGKKENRTPVCFQLGSKMGLIYSSKDHRLIKNEILLLYKKSNIKIKSET